MLDRSIKCMSDGKDIDFSSSRECEPWRFWLKDEVVLFYHDFYCIFRGSCLYDSVFIIIFHVNFEFFAIRHRSHAFSPFIIYPVPLSVDFLPSWEDVVSSSFVMILIIDIKFIPAWISSSTPSFAFTSFSVSFTFPSIWPCFYPSTIKIIFLSSSFVGCSIIIERIFSFSVSHSLNEISLICISIPRKIYSFPSQCSIYILSKPHRTSAIFDFIP